MSDEKIGPTGQFPNGKIRKDDEGEIRFGVNHTNGTVIIQFNSPVTWLSFYPHQARDLAKLLLDQATELERSAN